LRLSLVAWSPLMGNCCGGGEVDDRHSQPMSGSAVVGRQQGGATITRDEARERAAAAAEARATAANTRGQVGVQSKIKARPTASNASQDGRVNIADPRAWD